MVNLRWVYETTLPFNTLPSLILTVSASADEPINETTARQMTKLTNGFLIFTLTSYNKSLATRQGLSCNVIARVDKRRSLAQNDRVDTEGDEATGRRGDKETRGQGERKTNSRSSFHL